MYMFIWFIYFNLLSPALNIRKKKHEYVCGLQSVAVQLFQKSFIFGKLVRSDHGRICGTLQHFEAGYFHVFRKRNNHIHSRLQAACLMRNTFNWYCVEQWRCCHIICINIFPLPAVSPALLPSECLPVTALRTLVNEAMTHTHTQIWTHTSQRHSMSYGVGSWHFTASNLPVRVGRTHANTH